MCQVDTHCLLLSTWPSTFWFPDSNLNMLLLINLKLNRVVGLHLGYVAFEADAIWKSKMATMAPT